MIAELANPALKSIYKGKDAFSEYGDPEYWKGVGHAGKVGFFTSVAHGGTTGYIMKQSGAYADAQSVMEEIESLENRADKMDMDTFAQAEEKYNRSRKQNYQVLERVLQNASAKQRADIIKRYELSEMFAEDGSMQADFAKQLDTGTEAKYNKRYYNRVMRNNEDIIESDLERLNGDLAVKYGEKTQSMSVFDGELSEKGRSVASKVKKFIKIASEKSGKDIGFVITDGNVPQFRGVNVGDRIYMSADTFEKGDAYEVAVEETMHFAEGSEEHNALVKLLAEDGDLEARAVDEVLGANGYGFDGETIRDIGRRIEAGAVIEGESMTAEELRYSQKYFKFLHKNFPGESESKGSDAHKWATLWAARQDVEVGDQALASYHGRWYLIQRFNDADSGYQVEAFIPMAEYKKIAKEIAEYGRSGKVKSIQGETDWNDSSDKPSYSFGREGSSIDRTEAQYGREDNQVQKLDKSQTEGQERSGRDGGGDRESGGADRQGDPVTVTREEWLAYEEYRSEVGAHMGAELLGNEAFIDKIIRENGTLGEKILGKIIAFKEALGRIGDPEAQAQHKRLAEAEKLYLDAIEAAGKKYVDGKIVSADDDEEKENTAEGGDEYLYSNYGDEFHKNGKVYSYDFLSHQAPMRVLKLPALSTIFTDGKIDRGRIIFEGKENALAQEESSLGNDGVVYVKNRYTGKTIEVNNQSIRHGLGGKKNYEITNSRLGLIIGDIIRNGIPINALVPSDGAESTYAMVAYAVSPENKEFLAIAHIDLKSGKLVDYEAVGTVHSLRGRIKKGNTAATKSALGTSQDVSPIGTSTISISQLLDVVNSVQQGILSEDVLERLGQKRPEEGYYVGKVKFSLKENKNTGVDSQIETDAINGENALSDNEMNVPLSKEYKQYSQKEVKALVNAILSENLSFEQGQATFEKKADMEQEVKKLLDTAALAKTPEEGIGKIADYILGAARIKGVYADASAEVVRAQKTVDSLSRYIHSLDLTPVAGKLTKEDGKMSGTFYRWNNRKGHEVVSLEQLRTELAEQGFHVEGKTPEQIFFTMDSAYNKADRLLKKHEREHGGLRAILSEDAYTKAREGIVAKLTEVYRTGGRISEGMRVIAEREKNLAEREKKISSREKKHEKIVAGMSEAHRYQALKNRYIPLSAIVDENRLSAVQEKLSVSDADMEFSRYGDKKRLFKKLGEEFGVFRGYSNSDIELDFGFSRGNMEESVSKQKHNYLSFAKMLTCLDSVVDNAIGIEVHNRNQDGYKADPTLKNVYVLASAFVDGEDIVPVKLEIKEFSDKENALYVAIALESIKKDGIVRQEVAKGVARQVPPPSDISIAEYFKKINPSDESFRKYIPKQFFESETLYSQEEARAVIDKILAETLDMGEWRGVLRHGTYTASVQKAFAMLNSAEQGKRVGVALNFADYVIDHAILVDEIDPWEAAPYIETVDLLKSNITPFNSDFIYCIENHTERNRYDYLHGKRRRLDLQDRKRIWDYGRPHHC